MDMALVKLRRPIAPLSAVICLPEGESVDSEDFSECWFAGWGRCFVYGDLDGPVTQTKVDVIKGSSCQSLYKFQPSVARLCCYGKNKRPFCPGDSGGPLMCLGKDNRWRVRAVAIAKKRNCRTLRPELSGLFESVTVRWRRLVKLLRQASYRNHAPFPMPLRAPRRSVHFKSACASYGIFSASEPFVACVLANGTEVENGTEWEEAGFVYQCRLSRNEAMAKPVACLFNGTRLSPGQSFINSSFLLSCVSEKQTGEIKDSWMRVRVVACWTEDENRVENGETVLGPDGLNSTCSISYHGYEGHWLAEDGKTTKNRLTSISSLATITVSG